MRTTKLSLIASRTTDEEVEIQKCLDYSTYASTGMAKKTQDEKKGPKSILWRHFLCHTFRLLKNT